MGNFIGGIERGDYEYYDVCTCGNLMRAGSAMCLDCAAVQRAEEQEANWWAERLPQRQKRDAEYQRLMKEQGWTLRDVLADLERRREESDDPVRPRFWTGISIGQPR